MTTQRSPFHRGRPQLSVRAAAADEAEILIYDEIGFFGIQAGDVVRAIKGIQAARLHVRINSPGGAVTDGVAIYNALRDWPGEVITHVDALAASIASLIALAGREVRMADNALFMIHDAWGITIGNATDHRETADLLEKVQETTLVRTYASKTGQSADAIRELMAAETWFTAEEAEEAGFVDVVEERQDVAAAFDLSVFNKVPEALRGPAGTPTVRDLERALRDAGLSRSDARVAASAASRAVGQWDAGQQAELLTEVGRLTSTLTRIAR